MPNLDLEEIRRQVRVRRLLAFVPEAKTQVGDIRAAQLLASWKKRDRERFARHFGIEGITATQWKAFVWAVASRTVNAGLAEIRL